MGVELGDATTGRWLVALGGPRTAGLDAATPRLADWLYAAAKACPDIKKRGQNRRATFAIDVDVQNGRVVSARAADAEPGESDLACLEAHLTGVDLPVAASATVRLAVQWRPAAP